MKQKISQNEIIGVILMTSIALIIAGITAGFLKYPEKNQNYEIQTEEQLNKDYLFSQNFKSSR